MNDRNVKLIILAGSGLAFFSSLFLPWVSRVTWGERTNSPDFEQFGMVLPLMAWLVVFAMETSPRPLSLSAERIKLFLAGFATTCAVASISGFSFPYGDSRHGDVRREYGQFIHLPLAVTVFFLLLWRYIIARRGQTHHKRFGWIDQALFSGTCLGFLTVFVSLLVPFAHEDSWIDTYSLYALLGVQAIPALLFGIPLAMEQFPPRNTIRITLAQMGFSTFGLVAVLYSANGADYLLAGYYIFLVGTSIVLCSLVCRLVILLVKPSWLPNLKPSIGE